MIDVEMFGEIRLYSILYFKIKIMENNIWVLVLGINNSIKQFGEFFFCN